MREGKGKSSLLLKKAENYNHPWPRVSSLRISFFLFWLFASQSGILLWDNQVSFSSSWSPKPTHSTVCPHADGKEDGPPKKAAGVSKLQKNVSPPLPHATVLPYSGPSDVAWLLL